ncbi:phosphoglycerate mutase-like protein [Aureobasidium subglaciale]|nr:phosphoglycerate mutase-like protein [Aureobasidium subglaciale]
MGKPRMIIVIRHAQSEGNKNRDIHQMIPDHRVKLTDDGWKQAEEAGRRLRGMLKPDDTIQFFTSPYRRTRETTEGILSSLTEETEEEGPSPFPRHTIKVFEEPRLREQDFGNFQPCSTEMERMWQERADYGHFFYRIPNGESAADAYDRVSGFNESLWRNFSDEDFPSVCVLVTHGLMTRVFLMKWYHWSVEYFEDLRNVNHCEFVIMQKNLDSGKYMLQNQMRTWSEYKRRSIPQQNVQVTASAIASPAIPSRKWGGCVGGCTHQHSKFPRRIKKQNEASATAQASAQDTEHHTDPTEELPTPLHASSTASTTEPNSPISFRLPTRTSFLHGRDGGGSLSGIATPVEGFSDVSGAESDYFARLQHKHHRDLSDANPNNPSAASATTKRTHKGRPTATDLDNWRRESGMGKGARADPLGDEYNDHDAEEDGDDEQELDRITTNEPNGPSEFVEQLDLKEIEDKSIRGSVY